MKKEKGTKSKPKPIKISQFFEPDLFPKVKQAAKASGLSMSGYVQECVRKALVKTPKKKKAA